MTREWGVLYRRGGEVNVRADFSREGAEQMATVMNGWPGWTVEVVCREVSEWVTADKTETSE